MSFTIIMITASILAVVTSVNALIDIQRHDA